MSKDERPKKISVQQLLPELTTFFADPDNLAVILPILGRTTKVSLRLLDWFVVNYADEFNISYQLPDGTMFEVHAKYREQLQLHSKKLFDPFRRKGRLMLPLPDGEKVETTLGQLSFFRWCIQTRVIQYVDTHAEKIASNMRSSISDGHPSSDRTLVHGSSGREDNEKKGPRFVATVNPALLDSRKKYVVSFK